MSQTAARFESGETGLDAGQSHMHIAQIMLTEVLGLEAALCAGLQLNSRTLPTGHIRRKVYFTLLRDVYNSCRTRRAHLRVRWLEASRRRQRTRPLARLGGKAYAYSACSSSCSPSAERKAIVSKAARAADNSPQFPRAPNHPRRTWPG